MITEGIKKVIPAPPGNRGKVAYMLAMNVGEAFYDDAKTKKRYWRLRDYAREAKGAKQKFYIGDALSDGCKKVVVWRTA